MNELLKFLARSEKLRLVSPGWLKNIVRGRVPIHKYNRFLWENSNPYIGTDYEFKYSGNSEHKLGIIFDFSHEHKNYIAACIDLDISYEVIDITVDDWIEKIRNSDCAAYLVWPSVYTTVWKSMCKERFQILVNELGRIIYPSLNEIWLYESKRRTRDWLIAHGMPHPKTRVFYREEEAIQFLSSAVYPTVFKTDLGASSHGVKICRKRKQAESLVRRCFSRGYKVERGDPRDKQWDFVIFQEFLPDVKEWRMVRIGDSYMCVCKMKRGEYHSGSGNLMWVKPPVELLEMTRRITEVGGFTSMNIDIFETAEGRYLVNELHTVFGSSGVENLKRGSEYEGRYKYNKENGEWLFESGYFYQNGCANLRVKYLLTQLER